MHVRVTQDTRTHVCLRRVPSALPGSCSGERAPAEGALLAEHRAPLLPCSSTGHSPASCPCPAPPASPLRGGTFTPASPPGLSLPALPKPLRGPGRVSGAPTVHPKGWPPHGAGSRASATPSWPAGSSLASCQGGCRWPRTRLGEAEATKALSPGRPRAFRGGEQGHPQGASRPLPASAARTTPSPSR